MPRISLTEQYDNRDVIAQIYKMLDQVATGTFQSVDVQRVGGDYVFTFTDQRGDDHQFTVSANYVSDVDVSRLNGVYTFLFTYADGTSESFGFTINGVQNIASVQSGSTVTVTFTLDDGTTKTISFSAGGDMTTDTAQTVTAVKTFTASPLVPTAPAGSTDQTAANTNWISQTGNSAPNNLLHRLGDESFNGVKTSLDGIYNVTRIVAESSAARWVCVFECTNNPVPFSFILLPSKGQPANAKLNGVVTVIFRPGTSITYGYIKLTTASELESKICFTQKDSKYQVWIYYPDASNNYRTRAEMLSAYLMNNWVTGTEEKATIDPADYDLYEVIA